MHKLESLGGSVAYSLALWRNRSGWRERPGQICRRLPGRLNTACSAASGRRLAQVSAVCTPEYLLCGCNINCAACRKRYLRQHQLASFSMLLLGCSQCFLLLEAMCHAGDLRRALASTERLCIVLGNEAYFEWRDVAVLYLHAGNLPAALAHLDAYASTSAAKGKTSRFLTSPECMCSYM